jgi:hypothetical protein
MDLDDTILLLLEPLASSEEVAEYEVYLFIYLLIYLLTLQPYIK